MSKKSKKTAALHIATPFLLTAVCAGIAVAAAIKPYDKIKVYMNIAFMDSLKSTPGSSSGLVIRDNSIVTDYDGEVYDSGEVVRPKFGELYAMIRTKRMDLDIPVYWGSNTELLEYGACQSSSSVVIGTEGNSVISAHVDTYFADLEKLKVGDIVTLNTNYGEFTYKVRETIAFSDSDRRYIVPSDETRLTLYTCKRDLLGASNQRIGVICEPVSSAFYNAGKEDSE